MGIENVVDRFLRNDIGGTIVTDDTGSILYSDEKIVLSEHGMKRFISRIPARLKPGERKLWELTDNDRYYRIISTATEEGGKTYKCHCLTNVSELADLTKNISEYSRRISDFSDFQTKILEVLSKPYDSFLPALAELIRTDEALIRIERHNGEKLDVTVYNGDMTKTVADIAEDTFDINRFEKRDGYRCLLNETASDRRYSVMLKESALFSEDFFKDIGVYNVIRLYIENGVLREKIIYESEHDKLTDLYNAGKFTSMLRDELNGAATLAVYVISVGDLEYMNDHFGNATGDALIKRASECIHPDLSDDLFGFRIGGDKFAVVARDIDEEKAGTLITLWKERLAALNESDGRFKCTISCGMAYGKDRYDIDKLIEQADVGMYREKRRLKEELIKKAAVT